MNRVIKFRGKVLKGYNEDFFKQKFVYGSAIICEDDIASTIINSEFEAEVYTDTIGQFTGLLDKNEKEIYEGDILFADRKTNKIGKVIFDGGCFIIDFGDDSNFIATKNGFEIIGNIHENPELIK